MPTIQDPFGDRLLSALVFEPSGCVTYSGRLSPAGYGVIAAQGEKRYAHRVAYELLVGPIPKGLHLDHTCHNGDLSCSGDPCRHRACVNPRHLRPVTFRDNILSSPHTAASINAAKTHCIHGHPLSGDNLYVRPSGGSRGCKACRSENSRLRWAKIRTAGTLVVLLTALSVLLTVQPAGAENPPAFVYGGAEITRHYNSTRPLEERITLHTGRQAAHYLNGLVTHYLQVAEAGRCRSGSTTACEGLVRRIASRYGVSSSSAVAVARCESGLRASASNGGRYLGLFQQSASYWAGRARAYGFAGRSAFDPTANASVSMGMVRSSGWGAWECRP